MWLTGVWPPQINTGIVSQAVACLSTLLLAGGFAPAEQRDPINASIAARSIDATSGAQTGTIEGVLSSPFARRYAAAVYIVAAEGEPFAPPAVNPVMDQQNLMFTPHVLPVLVGSTVDFPNSDEVRHNVYTTKSSVCQFNLGTYPAGDKKSVTCGNLGVVTLLCNVHAEMSGYIVVSPTPYFATTDDRGRFVIEGVPPGTYSVTFWHQRLASQSIEVTVQPDAATHVEFTGLRRK